MFLQYKTMTVYDSRVNRTELSSFEKWLGVNLSDTADSICDAFQNHPNKPIYTQIYNSMIFEKIKEYYQLLCPLPLSFSSSCNGGFEDHLTVSAVSDKCNVRFDTDDSLDREISREEFEAVICEACLDAIKQQVKAVLEQKHGKEPKCADDILQGFEDEFFIAAGAEVIRLCKECFREQGEVTLKMLQHFIVRAVDTVLPQYF